MKNLVFVFSVFLLFNYTAIAQSSELTKTQEKEEKDRKQYAEFLRQSIEKSNYCSNDSDCVTIRDNYAKCCSIDHVHKNEVQNLKKIMDEAPHTITDICTGMCAPLKIEDQFLVCKNNKCMSSNIDDISCKSLHEDVNKKILALAENCKNQKLASICKNMEKDFSEFDYPKGKKIAPMYLSFDLVNNEASLYRTKCISK